MKTSFPAAIFSFLFVLASHGQFVFSLNRSTYASGETITATWSGWTTPSTTDWVGIYRNPNPGGPPDGNPVSDSWNYASSGTHTPQSPALADGSITLSNPGAGNWTAYFLTNDGYGSLGTVHFTVAAVVLPPVFTLNKSTYESGEAITATWSGRTNPTIYDWVGIYPRNVTPGSVGSTSWLYSDGTQTGSTALAAGSVTFTGPGLAPGQWTAFFLADDGYDILGSVNFTIANSPRILGFSADHAFINDGTPITLSWVADPGDGTVQTLTLGDGSSTTDVAALNVLDVSPLNTTTYTLTLNGTVTAQTRVFKDSGNTNSFSINASHFTAGSPLNVTWNGAAGNSDSWVGIYPAGDEPGADQAADWNYLNGTRTTGGSHPNGTIAFDPTVGDYYAVLFTNGGLTIEQGPIRFSVIADTIKPLDITNFQNDGGDLRIDWNSLPNEFYDVFTTTDFSDWFIEAANVRASSTQSSVFTAPNAAYHRRFYQVRKRP